MLIYLDNIVYSLQKAGGVSVYWYELTRRMLGKNDRILFIEPRQESNNIFRRDFNIPPENIIHERALPIRCLRYMTPRVRLRPHAIFHSSYYRVAGRMDALNIVTVHDFTYEYFRRGLPKWVHVRQKGSAIKNAAGIICVSEHTKQDLKKFHPGVPEEKIKVIYPGVSDEFKPLIHTPDVNDDVKRAVEAPFILYVGFRGGYKNFNAAVQTLADLKDYVLVFVGGSPLTNTERQYVEQKLGNRYCHLPGLGREELNFLYNKSFCLLYPSSYEGFGIPVAEAMRAGCPVVTVDTSSIPEVCGRAGLVVERASPELLSSAVKRLENDDLRGQMIRRGFEQSGKFTWDRCCTDTFAYYQQVFDGRK